MDMNHVVTDVTITRTCSIRPFKGSDEHKTVNLEINYSGLTIGDVFTKAARADVVSWQNGPGRKNFDQWTDGQRIKISARRPGSTSVDPETAMVAKLAAMNEDERAAFIRKLMEKASGM